MATRAGRSSGSSSVGAHGTFAPATWREGVHLSGSPIWCDARRRREVCFVSSAERLGRGGHGQLIGTPTTLALLGPGSTPGDLAVPLRQKFTLGMAALELIPSGRGIGAAALHVAIAGRSVLYAGPVRTVLGGAGGQGEARAADAVVVAAPFGEVRHEFPPLDRVAAQVVDWCKARTGVRPILVVDAALDALEVAQRLIAAGLAVSGSKAVRDAAARLADGPAIRSLSREPGVHVILEGERMPAGSEHTALVSGRAIDGHPGREAGFAWSHAAGREDLLAWIAATRAKTIYVTGACADAVVAALGPRARVLGPPRQMALW